MVKKRRVKRRLWLAVLVFFIITFLVVSKTYAIFERNAEAEALLAIGKWVIKLNNVEITTGQVETFTVTTFTFEDSTTVEDGYIAPGRSGYFDISLDATSTDVAVRYDIDVAIDTPYADNIVFSVTVPVGSSIIQTGPNTYSGVISVADIIQNKIINLRINIDWQNQSGYDATDTALGIVPGAGIPIPVTVNVVQYLGEAITPYVAP